jgi:serine/threonine protein kinase
MHQLLARTQTGQLLGTPNSMSPEQVAAEPAALDQRADVYALGVILFEMLAHRRPYRLDNRPLARAARLILEQAPATPRLPWLITPVPASSPGCGSSLGGRLPAGGIQ